MNRILKNIKALWVVFIILPFVAISVALEKIWDFIWGSRIKNKMK
jgi:hypothetical protein